MCLAGQPPPAPATAADAAAMARAALGWLGAAAGGAERSDLAGLAEEIRNRTARPDADDDDGFDDRGLRLARTFRGAGKLNGDLTPQRAAALAAVLEALGKRGGPEGLRSKWQRHHDALEEACRRLRAAGCLPERAGQPTQIQLHLGLDRLRGQPGAGDAEAAWAGAAAGPGDDCDATIVPVVTGHVDPDVLDRLAAPPLRRRDAKKAPGTQGGRDGQGGPGGQDGRDGHAEEGEAAAAPPAPPPPAPPPVIIARRADLLFGPARL